MIKTANDIFLPFVNNHAPGNAEWLDAALDIQIEYNHGKQYRMYNPDGSLCDRPIPSNCSWGRIGCTGFSSVNKLCHYITFEFDCGHSANQITSEQRDWLVEILSPYCDVVRSTGGEGLHCRCRLSEPVSCESRAEYSKICDAAIRFLVIKVGEDFSDLIESQGCILWLASIDQNEDSFKQLSHGCEPLDAQEVMALVVQPKPTKNHTTTTTVDPRVVQALKFIKADDFDMWIKIGLILKNEGQHYYDAWLNWSLTSPQPVPPDFESVWNGFKPDGELTLGTLFYLAKENGWKDNAVFKNYSGTGDDRKAIPLGQLETNLIELDLMPSRIGDELFVPWGDSVRYLRDKEDLFSYLKSKVQVDWSRVRCGVKEQELFRHLQCVAPAFKEVSHLPHCPKVPEVYYAHGEFPAGNKLEGFLDFFCAETLDDRQLLKAALLTQFWGGPPGTRPVVNITADSGRGSGKTTVAEKISELAGGCVNVLGTDTEKLVTRLLSPNAREKRIILIDNLKSDRFDWDGAEHLVTTAMISGRKLYCGEGERLNLFTWFITVNGCSLSTDMAQRSVIIKLARPENDPTWLTRLNAYIEEHREAIIGDALKALAGPKNEIGSCSRWATWEADVLSLVDKPEELQELIISRQKEIDADKNDARAIEDTLVEAIEDLGHAPSGCFHISTGDMAKVFNKTLDKSLSKRAVTLQLTQMINEGQVTQLVLNPSRNHGRGYIWNPGGKVSYELKDSLFSHERWAT